MIATLSTHTHCQVAQKAQLTSQNLSKSMFAPTLKNEMNKIKMEFTYYTIKRILL